MCSSETEIYQTLAGKAGISKVHWYGEEGDYRIMVFDLLGPSLKDLFCFCGRKFSLKTVTVQTRRRNSTAREQMKDLFID